MERQVPRSRQNFACRAASVSAVADYPHPLNPGRSANMRANRRKDTKPEVALRRALHAQGYRYRKDYRLEVAGTRVRPDIAFTARRVAVFVDGCFWHCCPEHGSQPANNTWYWEPKLARNVERDRAADAALAAGGWSVVRIWEHESLEAAVGAVVTMLAANGLPRTGRAGPGPAGTVSAGTVSAGTASAGTASTGTGRALGRSRASAAAAAESSGERNAVPAEQVN
jgi:DNA mismatch endonuclease (patch repair protein)